MRSHSLISLTVYVGTFVRITPNQVSIADPEAPQLVYGYSSGALKGDLYEGFTLFGRKNASMFATRLRDVHSRKRKYLSHVMSMKSIQELEPNVLHHQRTLVEKWDGMCAAGTKKTTGTVGSTVWRAKDGRVWFNCLPCEYSKWSALAVMSNEYGRVSLRSL